MGIFPQGRYALQVTRSRMIMAAAAFVLEGAIVVCDNNMAWAAGRTSPLTGRAVKANGPLIVLRASRSLGGTGDIVVVQAGRVARVLTRGLPLPFDTGIAASPQGDDVVFSESSSDVRAQKQGLWLISRTGGVPRRLLLAPRSVQGNQLGIGPVTWSPDHATLAYAVNVVGGAANMSRPEPALDS